MFFSEKLDFQNIERKFFSSYGIRHAPKEVLKAESRRSGTSILHENIKYFFKNGVLQLTEITMKTNVQSLFKLPERVYLNSEIIFSNKNTAENKFESMKFCNRNNFWICPRYSTSVEKRHSVEKKKHFSLSIFCCTKTIGNFFSSERCLYCCNTVRIYLGGYPVSFSIIEFLQWISEAS